MYNIDTYNIRKIAKTKYDAIDQPKIGDIIEGTIAGQGRSRIYIDLGPVGCGVIYGKEFLEIKNELRGLDKGKPVQAKVIGLENEQGYIELSLVKAKRELTWKELEQKKEQREILDVVVQGANKGGLVSEILGIPAFLPVSQLAAKHYPRVKGGNKTEIFNQLQKLVGQKLMVGILDVDPEQGKLILSEKIKETKKITEILKNYKEGDIIEGEITGIVDFGAFAIFPVLGKPGNQLEGLIHISELGWQVIDHPRQVVKKGQKIKAMIIGIKNDQISLSLKRLQRDPWQNIHEKYKQGEIIKGKINKLTSFGALVMITPEIQGLAHISNLVSTKKINQELKVGQEYNFRILTISSTQHKMSLKLITDEA